MSKKCASYASELFTERSKKCAKYASKIFAER